MNGDSGLPALLANGTRKDPSSILKILESLDAVAVEGDNLRAFDAALMRLQVMRAHRRMSIGIYDHALHVVGGGQKYVATMASVLQEQFDVTYLVHEDVDLANVAAWYDLDLSRCKKRVIPLPFYRGRSWIDSSVVTADMENPFEAVARASGDYDVFVNANMLEKVRPLAPLSVIVCHFPDVLPRAHFAAHEYTVLVANSRYTCDWVRRRWGLSPAAMLYPPIDMEGPAVAKERLILSAARFEPGGSKKQLELIEAFEALCDAAGEELSGWRLVLAGGSLPRNAYLERVRDRIAGSKRIEVRVNVAFAELRDLYSRASIFWHACGLGERDPRLIEHFGMTTAEAMQNGCAPVVFDGGGQREIVEEGVNGFRFRALDELCATTLRLIRDPALRGRIQTRARSASRAFDRSAFEERVRALFAILEREYRTSSSDEAAGAGRDRRGSDVDTRDRTP